MKPVDVKSNTYINSDKKINKKDPNLKIDDIATFSWTYVISHLKDEEIVGTFYEKELQKANQEVFRAEKVIGRKGNKLYIKRKGSDNLIAG